MSSDASDEQLKSSSPNCEFFIHEEQAEAAGLASSSGGGNDLEDFEPQPRDRCNTWPLQKQPGVILSQHTSPLIHEEIPEEDKAGDGEPVGSADDGSDHRATNVTDLFGGSCSDRTSAGDFGGSTKRSTSRRNAWGNLSYADLITQAILSSPENRLTLSQIYEWMVKNVPYFRDKGDSNSSAGWKVINDSSFAKYD